jgi:DNA-binding NarL/FixJ family response regulator
MTAKIQNVLLVDDHPIIRHGLKLFLSNLGYQVNECENGKEAVGYLQKHEAPDVVVLDVDMPEMNGIEVAGFIKGQGLGTYMVFLTSHTNMDTFAQAYNTEFNGFLFKETAVEEIVHCFDTIKQGERFIGPNCRKYYDAYKKEVEKHQALRELLNKLTKTEKEVLKQIASRKTTPQIAEFFFKSEKTIENHRYNICQKLEIKGSNNLLAFALEYKNMILGE